MNTKLRISGFLTGTLILILNTAAGQVTEFNTPAAWGNVKKVIFKPDGSAEFNGEMEVLVSKALIKIDPSKTYRLSGEFRQIQGSTSINFLGFIPKGEKKEIITPLATFNVAGTDTEVVENCEDTDNSIKIKDGSKWQTISHYRMVLNTSPDFSDLPNNNLLNRQIKEVKKEGDIYLVSFDKPIGKDITAGTKVRLHSSGGYLYTAGIIKPTSEWQLIAGEIKEIAKSGYSPRSWPPGTVYAEVILMLNWSKTNAVEKPLVEFRNIRLEELNSDKAK